MTYAYLRRILVAGRDRNASDVTLRADQGTYYRIEGDNVDDTVVPSSPDLAMFIEQYAPQASREALNEQRSCGFAVEDDAFGRLRVQAAYDIEGLSITARYIAPTVPTLEELDIPNAVSSAARARQGLVLVSGAVGSGKTTLVNTLLAHIVLPSGRDGIEIADPIEYRHRDASHWRQYEIGTHFATFFEGCLHQLRCNASVFVLGEVRDVATARALLLSAEAGALCFATLHTSRTVDVADRLLALFPAAERDLARTQLAHTLVGIIGPRLIKRVAGGRRVAVEWLPGAPAVRNHIQAGDTTALEQLLTSPGGTGTRSLEYHLASLVRRGEIEAKHAAAAANNPPVLADLLRRAVS